MYVSRLRNNVGLASPLLGLLIGGISVLGSFYFIMAGMSALKHVSADQTLKSDVNNILDERLAYMRAIVLSSSSPPSVIGIPSFARIVGTTDGAPGDVSPTLNRNPNTDAVFTATFPGRTRTETIPITGHPFTIKYEIQLYKANFDTLANPFISTQVNPPGDVVRLTDIRLIKLVALATQDAPGRVVVRRELDFSYSF